MAQVNFNIKDAYLADLYPALEAKFGPLPAGSTNEKRLKSVLKAYLMRILVDYMKVKIEQELLGDIEV